MKKYHGKTLDEWKKYIKEDGRIGIRTQKYILVLEEQIKHGKLNQPTIMSCVKCQLPLDNSYKLLEHEHGDYACRNCDARYIKNESGLLHYYPIT